MLKKCFYFIFSASFMSIVALQPGIIYVNNHYSVNILAKVDTKI